MSAMALTLGARGVDIDELDEALRSWLVASEGEATSDHTTSDSSSDADTRPPKPTKKRKATYYQRKDEIDELRNEATKLEHELRRLTPITGPSDDVYGLRGLFQRDIERNNLRLAGAQVMLSSQFEKQHQSQAMIPLTCHIRLPKNDAARFQVLESLRESKLQSALQFMTERTRPLDLTQFHRQIQTFDLPGGDFAYTGLDVIQFTGGYSVRQVFDEFVFYGANQEMSVTESVGMLTIRESGELEDVHLGQSLMVAKVAEGLEVEANVAIFSACIDSTDGSPGYAISAVDFVDEDELHPYQSDTRGRKELVAAVMFSEVETPQGRVVAMSKWSHIRFRMPPNELSEDLEDTLQDSMMQWCDVMPQVIRERLAMQSPAP